MKKFWQVVLSKIFGGFIEQTIQTRTESILSAYVSLVDGWRQELAGHREYLKIFAEDILRIKNQLTPAVVKKFSDPSLHEFPEKGLKIRTKIWTENDKDRKEFYPSLPCWEEGRPDFQVSYPWGKETIGYTVWDSNSRGYLNRCQQTTESISKFVNTLFATNCVTEIHTENAFAFKLSKPASITWEEALPKINQAIASLFPDVPTTSESSTDSEEGEPSHTSQEIEMDMIRATLLLNPENLKLSPEELDNLVLEEFKESRE